MPKIRSLAVNTGKQKEMKYEQKIKLIEHFGIEGDRFSKHNDSRQIMIVDGNLYDLHNLKKGVLRENILIDDLDINSLNEGQIISVNNSSTNATSNQIDVDVYVIDSSCFDFKIA